MLRLFARFFAPACVVAGLLVGCSNDKTPMRVDVGPPFVADSPIHLLRLVEWSFNNLDEEAFATLFSGDYEFGYAALDTNGNAYRDVPWLREDELISAHHLFLGGGPTQPAATSISLRFDRNMMVTEDPRPGKTEPWHQSIRTSVVLDIKTADGSRINITGYALFFMTRGDSATVPSGLPGDSGHWYVDRWEDETVQPSWPRSPVQPPVATPEDAIGVGLPSWGTIKALYR